MNDFQFFRIPLCKAIHDAAGLITGAVIDCDDLIVVIIQRQQR